MIFNCLRHWVHNYHVDGFRFDLASILSRDRNGQLVANPPLVEMIGESMLRIKIIAEAWDAAGMSIRNVCQFAVGRMEWTVSGRCSVLAGTVSCGKLATRLAGSSDLYQRGGRNPTTA